MRQKRVANLLELRLDGQRLEEDDEDALFDERSRLRVGDGLLDWRKADVAVAPRGPEDHALEAHLLLGGDDAGDGAEAHVEVGAGLVVVGAGEEGAGLVGGGAAAGELGDGEAGGVGHEEAAGLLEDLLELHLLVVLARELFGVGVELLELGFVALKLDLEALQELRPARSLPPRSARRAAPPQSSSAPHDGGVALQKRVDVPGRFQIQPEVIALVPEEPKLPLQLVASSDVADVTALEGGEVGIEVRELDGRELPEVGEAVVGGVLVHDEGDVLHVLGAEPARHDWIVFSLIEWIIVIIVSPP
mmetsp:Transcript_12256/g.29957  ORF Transcript_12256/g.29957 Transcript_12256/m.29957 type:complete len:304 (+) Transcript_12256:1910-2821(+)